MTTANLNLTFSRWTNGALDRIYVNGHGHLGVKYWLEALSNGDYIVKTDRRCSQSDATYGMYASEIMVTLRELFGADPTWQQMIDACN